MFKSDSDIGEPDAETEDDLDCEEGRKDKNGRSKETAGKPGPVDDHLDQAGGWRLVLLVFSH